MSESPILDGRLLDRARETFAEMDAAESLLAPEAGRPARVGLGRLYAAAAGPDAAPDPEVEAELARNPAARAAYRRLVAAAARYAFPVARAASTGAPVARHGEGCRIRYERSLAEPGQVYVIVEVTAPPAEPPQTLIVCDADDACRRFPLPPMRDGVAQIVCEADSELMRLLAGAATVYLR